MNRLEGHIPDPELRRKEAGVRACIRGDRERYGVDPTREPVIEGIDVWEAVIRCMLEGLPVEKCPQAKRAREI